MLLNKHKWPLWVRFSSWLALVLFRPVVYVMVGATIGLGLLAAVFGADPSAVMADFMIDATVEVTPLVWHLLGIWAILTTLAALLSASAGELYRLSNADRARIAYTLLGKVAGPWSEFLIHGVQTRRVFPNRLSIWRNKWSPGIHPPLVYE